MALEVVRSRASDQDIERIFDHLVEAYQARDDPVGAAINRAAAPLRGIEDAVEGLGRSPFQGTLRPDLLPGLRQVAKDRAILYFFVDEPAGQVRVLAVFFAGQDHRDRMRRHLGD